RRDDSLEWRTLRSSPRRRARIREIENEASRRTRRDSRAAAKESIVRIALSTGGGDAPGLNAVIRAAVLSAVSRGWEVLGVKRGYAGLLGEDEVIPLNAASVGGIAHLGGTILRTS